MLVALLVLMAVVLGRDRPGLPAARAGAALCLGLCAQVIGANPMFEALVPRLWQTPLIAVSVGNAVLFWVFVRALFDDEFRLGHRHGAIWLAVVGLAAIGCTVGVRAPAWAMAAAVLQRGMTLLFVLLATIAAASHWRSDLVEGRRRLRVFIVLTGSVYTVAMLLVRLDSPQGRLSALSAALDVVALLFIVSVVAWRLLTLAGSDLFPAMRPAARLVSPVHAPSVDTAPVVMPPTEPAPSPSDPAEERLADALRRLMTDQRAYRAEDLTVASLAARLGAPEYRLRRLINQRLGHRNFNAFVNGFRLEEARLALADPARRELPVLTIALDAGFQSIGPFNRAFKAATGLTPTEFRRERLADS